MSGRQEGRSALVIWALLAIACAAPISTQRSPYHLRVVEVRNDTDHYQMLTIEPAADQQLGAATTFTGRLRPGEVKVLYLYHGLDYRFAVLDERSRDVVAESRVPVHRNLGLVYNRDGLEVDASLAATLGKPTVTFSDSLQENDPFGLRSGDTIEPDTTNVRRPADLDSGLGTRARGQRP